MTDLDDVRRLALETRTMALAAARRRGAQPDGPDPALRAVAALTEVLDGLELPDPDREAPGLGLRRGASDLEWPEEDSALVDAIYAVEDAWDAACLDHRARSS